VERVELNFILFYLTESNGYRKNKVILQKKCVTLREILYYSYTSANASAPPSVNLKEQLNI
jgi:hypothetical protein